MSLLVLLYYAVAVQLLELSIGYGTMVTGFCKARICLCRYSDGKKITKQEASELDQRLLVFTKCRMHYQTRELILSKTSNRKG
jgi:hypothetical protein